MLALRKHEKKPRGAHRLVMSLLGGTFATRAYSYLTELSHGPILPPPLWDIGLLGLVCFGLVYWWQHRQRAGRESSANPPSRATEQTATILVGDGTGNAALNESPVIPMPERPRTPRETAMHQPVDVGQ